MDKFLAIVVIIAGLYIASDWYGQRSDNKSLQKYGVDTISQPFNEYVEMKKSGVVVGYKIKVPFETESGSVATCNCSVSKGVIERLKASNSEPVIKVRYLPSKTSICAVANEERDADMFILLVAIVMMSGGVVYLYNTVGLGNGGE